MGGMLPSRIPSDGGAGNYNPAIPAYTPGPIGTGDGGVGAYNPAVDTSGVAGQVAPFQPQPQFSLPDVAALFKQALANSGYNSLDSSLQRAREQLIERFGDSTLASMAGLGLDPQAAAFTQQNYLSGNADLARLDKQREQARRAAINKNVLHGLLFSGQTGYDLGQAESGYGQARYDLTNKYLDQLQALLDNTLQQKNSIRSSLASAFMNAFGNYFQSPNELAGLFDATQ